MRTLVPTAQKRFEAMISSSDFDQLTKEKHFFLAD